jgi:photosystem II stability/assembly factor-like uncharacterized protein
MQPFIVLAGTADGLRVIHIDSWGAASVVTEGLHGNAVRGVAVDPSCDRTVYVACGLRGWGLHVTRDAGRTFESLGFEDEWVWDVVVDQNNSDRLLIGTEPPALYESVDGGATFTALAGIHDVESRERWTFFHAPFHAGHLHGIAITPERPERIIVGVEHGGLLVSKDHGASWQDVMPGADLHRVSIDPADPDRVYAGAGHGLFVSEDGGQTWSPVDGLRGRYVHGIQIDPRDSDRVYVYVDSSHCPIHRTLDGGDTWENVGAGLPASRPADPIRLHPDEPDILVYAGDSDNGSYLYLSRDRGDRWERTDLELPKVWRMHTVARSS